MTARRDLLHGFAAALGMELCAPLARALAQATPPPDPKAGFTATRPLFAPSLRAILTGVCDRIVPATDTPGAVAAGVPAFIEMMLMDWYQQKDRVEYLTGLLALHNDAFARFGQAFIAITPQQQDVVLTAAMNGGVHKLPPGFFEHARQLVLLGYYTSEIGCKQERIFLPVPQHYDGAYPYVKSGKIFSS